MDRKEFKNVWYLSKQLTWEDFSLFPYQRSATLRLKQGYLEVVCGDEIINISNIKHISIGKQGRDFVNDWVKIDYGDKKTAYFADGSVLGWGGIIGGTNRIFEAIKQHIYPEHETDIAQALKEDGKTSGPHTQKACSDVSADTACKRFGSAKQASCKHRNTAIWLSIFLGFWAWLYTWEKDQWKFWTGLGVTIITLGLGGIVFHIWAIIDALGRTERFYENG